MASAALPISEIVSIVVTIAPVSPPTPQFNQGLIVGTSAVIPSTGSTSSRIRQYSSLAGMLADGFTTASPEYIAASLYFAQTPTPQFVWIGRQDLSSIKTVNVHAGAAGSGYVVGDNVLVVQGGASLGFVNVTSIGGGGAVTGIQVATINGVIADGTGYSVANSLTTSGGTGTGLQIDITAVGETPLVAITACRALNPQWYMVYSIAATSTDHPGIAAYIQSATPASFYVFNTADAAVLNNTAGNIFATLKASGYSRTMGIYSTTQSGAAPNNAYTGAALMGMAMGHNTGLAGSFFTFALKTLTGITVEPLTQTQFGNIAGVPGQGTGLNGNVYVNFGSAYSLTQQGVVFSGQFADEVLNLDMLSADIQFSIMNLLVSSPAVPQTDPGQTQILHAVNQAAQRAVQRGYIGPGVWQGPQLLNLATGDRLPAGYLSQSAPYATQSASDNVARKSMPVYLALNEAGAAQSVIVNINVQR